MLHFLPNYFFFAAERQHKKRLGNQTPRAFTWTRKKHAMLHWCNIFRHPHQQNTSAETIAKKTRNHVTFPRHTRVLHIIYDVLHRVKLSETTQILHCLGIFFSQREMAQKTSTNPHRHWVYGTNEKITKKLKKIPFGIFLARLVSLLISTSRYIKFHSNFHSNF